MTIIDCIREAAQDLAHRSPVVVTSRSRVLTNERNAFILAVD